MTPQQFVAKWSDAKLSERAGYQAHFNDLCALFGHPKPTEMGANDEVFCFEKNAARAGKKVKGWADVWKRDAFAWEYKGAHRDLDDAYLQLLRYHDALGNVPVLVVFWSFSGRLRFEHHHRPVSLPRTDRRATRRDF